MSRILGSLLLLYDQSRVGVLKKYIQILLNIFHNLEASKKKVMMKIVNYPTKPWSPTTQYLYYFSRTLII